MSGPTSDVLFDLGAALADERDDQASALAREVQPLVVDVPSYTEMFMMDDEARAANYNDELIYQVDKWLRGYYREVKDTPLWKQRNGRNRKYAFTELFKMIFGRDYDVKQDSKSCNVIAKVFAYYSTRVQKEAYVCRGETKKLKKKVYTLSPKRFEKPAYSLRLRVEELGEDYVEGLDLRRKTARLRLPKDDLSTGHARSPRTEAHMRERAERARERQAKMQREVDLRWLAKHPGYKKELRERNKRYGRDESANDKDPS